MGKGDAVDILFVATEDLASLEAIATPAIREILKADLKGYSWRESQLIDDLASKLGELSPNGRLLTEEGVKAACRRLSDDDLRSKLMAILSALGDTAAPKSALERLDQFAGRSDSLDTLLADPETTISQFSIVCSNCDLSQLQFKERDRADEAIANADRRCGACGERNLEIQDTFTISQSYTKSLRQGLWLESLASDILSSQTDAVWTGQMVEGDEVDVVAVLHDQVILIECKDTSFGQTDLYVTSVKAENVGADVVVIVTTRDVHPNVRAAMAKVARANPDRAVFRDLRPRDFHLISESCASVIREEILSVIAERSATSLREWVVSDPYQFFY